jgi:hypothetical protein
VKNWAAHCDVARRPSRRCENQKECLALAGEATELYAKAALLELAAEFREKDGTVRRAERATCEPALPMSADAPPCGPDRRDRDLPKGDVSL